MLAATVAISVPALILVTDFANAQSTIGFRSAVFHRLNFVMPARNAFIHAFLAVHLIWLNERESQRLIALRARDSEAVSAW